MRESTFTHGAYAVAEAHNLRVAIEWTPDIPGVRVSVHDARGETLHTVAYDPEMVFSLGTPSDLKLGMTLIRCLSFDWITRPMGDDPDSALFRLSAERSLHWVPEKLARR